MLNTIRAGSSIGLHTVLYLRCFHIYSKASQVRGLNKLENITKASRATYPDGPSHKIRYKTSLALQTLSISLPRPSLTPHKPSSLEIPYRRNMSTTRDVTGQSDITKMKVEADGSFKRLDASFRNTIAPGTRFEAEAGMFKDIFTLYFKFNGLVL